MPYPENKFIYHGDHDANDNQISLKAGQLSMTYENGSLRHISADGHELVRMIYMAVRDKEWITVKPEISGEEFGIFQDSFTIKYVALYSYGDIRFFARFKLQGTSDGSLILKFEGKALSDFLKNRIGFCVLHPVKETAGSDCIIETPEKEVKISRFPEVVSPHQPFTDIAAMHWNINGLSCRLEFSGDIFETEDQRNWTDASFKTYSTPLRIPYPAKLSKGDHISQRVVFRIKGTVNSLTKGKKNLISVNPGRSTSFPALGIGRSTRPKQLSEAECKILKTLPFRHYRTDLFLFDPAWKNTADIAYAEAQMAGYKHEFALFFDEAYEAQAREFVEWAKNRKANIVAVLLFDKLSKRTPDELTATIAPIIRGELRNVLICTGTNRNFAQVNRDHPGTGFSDNICYAIHPQEHADDNLTLVENLEGQKYTVDTARSFAGENGIWISPVNIQRRFNANTGNYEIPGDPAVCPPQVDTRMMSLFGAAWTAISLKYLAEAGVTAITFHETVGERGIMQGDYPSRWPADFPAQKGMLFPVFHVFQFIPKSGPFRTINYRSSNPLTLDALALSDGKKIKMIIVNFTSAKQEATIEGAGEIFTVKQLNAASYSAAATDPAWLQKTKSQKIPGDEKIVVEPYSVSFIESSI